LSEVPQLSRSRRPKWHYLAVGVGLIVVAVALTVAWGILAAPETAGPRAVAPARVVAYFFGSLLFMLLIAGLVLIVLLLLREVRLNERQSNFVSAVTHELKTPVASILAAGLDRQPSTCDTTSQKALPLHENVRGSDYYH